MTLDDRILFTDVDAIVIDKPAGLPVDRPKRGGDSIQRRLHELQLGFRRLPTPMHRLDQDTSGCLLFARSPKARASLQAAFETGTVEKVYLAILAGVPEAESGRIELALSKHSTADAGWRMVADPAGKAAITDWRRLAVRDGRSLIEFRPRTGRTHQIRVHAREGLGGGIVGDFVYGVPGGPMLLHASQLVVPRVTKSNIDATAPLPDHWGDWRDAV